MMVKYAADDDHDHDEKVCQPLCRADAGCSEEFLTICFPTRHTTQSITNIETFKFKFHC